MNIELREPLVVRSTDHDDEMLLVIIDVDEFEALVVDELGAFLVLPLSSLRMTGGSWPRHWPLIGSGS